MGKTMSKQSPPDEVLIPKTLSQSVYNHLKESIISNKIKSGQKLHEKEIADLFQVSSTPVREAIFMLGAEGLVTIKSHKEVVVKELSHQELKEIFQVLSVLESYAVSLAVEFISSEDLIEIEELQKEMASYCKKSSIEKYCELNRAIHDKLWELVPNEFLKKTLHSVHNQFQRYSYAQYFALGKPGALKRSLRDHEEVLEALKTKNKRRLKTLLARHWGSLLRPSSFEKGLKEYLSID
jgi:DNA-binding GntR family transcriptional regulator